MGLKVVDGECPANCPPELAKLLFEAGGSARRDKLSSATSFDVWGFGCLLYLLCTGCHLFKVDQSDNLDGIEEWRRLAHWKGLEPSRVKAFFSKALVPKEMRSAAVDLVEKCLNPDPDQRIAVHEILEHTFFSGESAQLAQILAGLL